MEGKREKATLYPCEPSVHSSLLLCVSVSLWLISSILDLQSYVLRFTMLSTIVSSSKGSKGLAT